MKTRTGILMMGLLIILAGGCSKKSATNKVRQITSFDDNWKFQLADSAFSASDVNFDDAGWRTLNVPHDWSIEGKFSETNPATVGGGALPGGIGWYRKHFSVSKSDSGKLVFIDFDGVYCNSEVWINNHYLGKRPYGYSSFRYELTPYLNYDSDNNVIAVKVDNSRQPNSRWYSGSGIYRNVWLVTTNRVHIDHWGTFVSTSEVNEQSATVNIKTNIKNGEASDQDLRIISTLVDPSGKEIKKVKTELTITAGANSEVDQTVQVNRPGLWSIDSPELYKVLTTVEAGGKTVDDYVTPFGIRFFQFDSEKGFSLNGKPIKILGVCDHHDLGCLGSAINTRALERQLEILKAMGCNAIRTSHNPPAPELLNLCDKMGFIVMDEAFDMWKKQKNPYDYHLYWDEWHQRDLEDLVIRDRNHPSVFIWSIGNEIPEQWDSTGIAIARELSGIVKGLDTTRPITSACNDPQPYNNIIKSGALDLIGYNYHQQTFADFPKVFPGKKFIATETTSALATRGHYDMPSDSIRHWPVRWDLPFTAGNPDHTCSAYDNCCAPWGSTHEETWKIVKKYDFLSGMFIWTGFDYIGEPTPYGWPSRSSYFGIIDLAGFPKDVYYMYQSEWTNTPVLHIFPNWNIMEQKGWNRGDTVDVWAYYNQADEVELFLNGKSLGVRKKGSDDLHVSWRVAYNPGTLKAVSRKDGKEVLVQEIKTAGKPASIALKADRSLITADGKDLSFITVKILDKDGNLVPYADNLVNFEISGEGFIAGVDNGNQTSLEPFKAAYRKAFNGLCLAVIQSNGKAGEISLTAKSEGLNAATLQVEAK